MGRFKELTILTKAKIQEILATKKGKIGLGIGVCAIAAVLVSAIAISNISSSVTAADNRFKIDAVASSSQTGTSSSNSSGSVISSESTPSSASSIPIVSAASAPSGAAPTAAQALQTVPVTSVDFNHRSLTLSIGASSRITANITPDSASDRTLAWTSTNNAVATVDQSGNVKAVGVGTASIRATNPDGQRDTCTVTVPGDFSSSEARTGKTANSVGNPGEATGNGAGNTGGNTGGGSGTLASQYVRVDTTRTYTDEITGIAQTVHFQGVGFANEVGGGYADINTTPALGMAHKGPGTASLLGPVNETSNAVVGGAGIDSSFVFDNLTAGIYTLQLTAHDGTVVAKYSFTVNSTGNIE
ncbi:Ig-like domain-containing protein [Ethanoligenens sp.]|uniref:Ig-like domain-containing protein n=1 Tax=Ethanoligenens sp. TaxID=2099655 RepID=UPI0039EBFAC8